MLAVAMVRLQGRKAAQALEEKAQELEEGQKALEERSRAQEEREQEESERVEMTKMRHLILLSLKPETPDEAISKILGELRALPEQIKSIKRLEIGRQNSAVDDGRNATLGGIVEFASEADYMAYAKDPAHLRVTTEHIKPHIAPNGRTALQVETKLTSDDGNQKKQMKQLGAALNGLKELEKLKDLGKLMNLANMFRK